MKNKKIILLILVLLLAVAVFSACGGCDHNYIDGVCSECGDTKPDSNPETESVSAPESDGESASTTVADSEAITVGDPDSETTPATDTESKVVTDGETASATEGESRSESESVSNTETEPSVDTDGESTPVIVETESDSESVSETDTDSESISEPDTETESTPVADCEHDYANGVCTKCGEADPDHIPADGGASMYDDIVDDFKNLILYKYINEELPPRGDNDPYYFDALYEVAGLFDPTTEMGYAFKDINDDKYVELMLIGRDSRLYAIFTIIDNAPALVTTFQKGMGYLSPDGIIFYNTKEFDANGGQIFLGNHITRLVGGELVGIAYGWIDTDSDFSTEDDSLYYCAGEDGIRNEMTYEEYKILRSLYEHFWDYPTRLTKLSGLKFNPTLLNSSNPQTPADFSTYDAIINTFGLMHSDVAGGKYVRTDWISSEYDLGMIFNSNEDYVLYNKLIAACTLVQNSSKAAFGYAVKDLNGDGVDELILLESKFYVLAIFTQVDGTPVLLDTYTDLRSACIDADGLIHVKQRIIPGNKKDYEYFVYEVKGAELVCKTAIGVKYSPEGAQDSWYKTVDGVTSDIEQTEWDALYAEYSIDIGTMAFNEYTELNSGLEFVRTPAIEE